jgi:recombination protein RecR
MQSFTESLGRLIEEFAKLPGVGRRSAERMAYHVLSVGDEEAMGLARAIRDVKKLTRRCGTCGGLTEEETCRICSDERRDRSCICVVEYPRDAIQIEKTGAYKGLYHVLMGHLSPVDGKNPEDLRIKELMARIEAGGVKELVLALNPNLEGDATAAYIATRCEKKGVRLTRPARGLPAGSELEFTDERVLAGAFASREAFKAGGAP